MIRALHPSGPGPLCYWGRPEHLPEPTTPALGARLAPFHC